MVGLCKICSSTQNQVLADVDGSQVICSCIPDASLEKTSCPEVTAEVQSGKKRKRISFITANEFEKKVTEKKPTDISRWADLPLHTIFKVKAVKDINVNRDGKQFISRVGEIENEAGESRTVWLTSVAKEKLDTINAFDAEHINICSLGLKTNKKGNRKYYDCEVVKRLRLNMYRYIYTCF